MQNSKNPSFPEGFFCYIDYMKSLLANYKNGNHTVCLYSDGTKIKETIDPSADHFTYDFPENMDIKITDYCDGGCPYCHENSTMRGVHGDLGAISKTIESLHAGTELAIGGGNALAHPGLIPFLEKLKDLGIVSNITINQRHIQPFLPKIENMVNYGLVHGIGVSLVDSSDKETFDLIDGLGDNVVIHTIAGILCKKDIPVLSGRKVLILGYKDLRRGHAYIGKKKSMIDGRIGWLRDNIQDISKKFRVMSFDCLGISQIHPKEGLGISDSKYASMFQGDDTDVRDKDGNITCATMYMDVPNMTVARMSTAALDKRFGFTGREPIESLLGMTTKGW